MVDRVGTVGNANWAEAAARRAAEEAARRAAEAAARQAAAEQAARGGAAPAAPAGGTGTRDGGVGSAAAAEQATVGPQGEVAVPTFAGEDPDLAGFGELPEEAPDVEALPARFDAATRDAFIGSELDRLGLDGNQRAQKQNRMLTLFRLVDHDEDGVVEGPGEREALVRGLIAGAQADAISQGLQARFAEEADRIEAESAAATDGNPVARGFNSLLNTFNHNMDQMDQARDNAVYLLEDRLPSDLARYNDMVAEAAGDPAALAQAQAFLDGSLARAQASGAEFDRRLGDFSSSNKFWSGLAADVAAGLLVLGGTALAVTGFGAPVGAGLIAAGFAAGGAASVGAHALLDNQYDFREEALGNFVVGGINAAATVATAGASAGVTTAFGSQVARYAGSQAITSGLTTFAQEGAGGFQDGWVTRVVVGTTTGAALGRASNAFTGAVTQALLPASGGFVRQAAAHAVGGAVGGAVSSAGSAVVNETLTAIEEGGFQEGAGGRIVQQALGGALAGGAQAAGGYAIERGVDAFATSRALREDLRVDALDAEFAAAAEAATRGEGPLYEVGTPDEQAVIDPLGYAAGRRELTDRLRAELQEALRLAGDADGAGGRGGDGPDGGYVARAEDDLYAGSDAALRDQLEASGDATGAGTGRANVTEFDDLLPHLEVQERLLARNPEALRALYDGVFEAVGVNPEAARHLVHAYTHSNSRHNPEIYYAIVDAVEHYHAGGGPRPPAYGPDGEVARAVIENRDGSVRATYPQDHRYDAIVAALLDTRAARAALLHGITGQPLPNTIRSLRGTSSDRAITQLLQAWRDPAAQQIPINHDAVASSTADPEAAHDFGLDAYRSQTVAADPSVAPWATQQHQAYVTYDLDVPTTDVLFDRLTDGYYSTEGSVLQRTQHEVLIATDRNLTVERGRAQIHVGGRSYGADDAPALIAALQAAGYAVDPVTLAVTPPRRAS